MENEREINDSALKIIMKIFDYSIENDLDEIVKAIIEQEKLTALINYKEKINLFDFAEKNKWKLVQLSIEIGINPSIKNQTGWTVWHEAVIKGRIEIVKLILDKNNVNPLEIEDNNGVNAFHLDVLNNDEGILKLLIGQNNNVFKTNANLLKTLMNFSKTNKYEEIFCIMAQNALNPKDFSREINFENFANNKKWEYIIPLIKIVVVQNSNLITIALNQKRTDLVKMMIENGIKPITLNLIQAIQQENFEIVELFSKYLDLNSEYNGTPLYAAMCTKNVALVKFLLRNPNKLNDNDNKANPNTISNLGGGRFTHLYFAITMSDIEMVKILLENGADLEKYAWEITKNTYSPPQQYNGYPSHLHSSSQEFRILTNNSQVRSNTYEETRQTHLGATASQNNIEIVKLLLEKHGNFLEKAEFIKKTYTTTYEYNINYNYKHYQSTENQVSGPYESTKDFVDLIIERGNLNIMNFIFTLDPYNQRLNQARVKKVIEEKKIDLVKHLYEKELKDDPNKTSYNWFNLAFQAKNQEILKYLISKGENMFGLFK